MNDTPAAVPLSKRKIVGRSSRSPGKALVYLLAFAVLGHVPAMPASLTAATTTVKHVLPNLCSGPPADPLPPLRPNQPSAAEMAAKPKQHPYLFFDAASRQALRARAKHEPFHSMAKRLLRRAEECLKREIPQAKQHEQVPLRLADGSPNPEVLENVQFDEFGGQGYAIKYVLPTLAFAYQLTGDARFGKAGKKWLLELATREHFAPEGSAEGDFTAGNAAYGIAIGYDWLWELLDNSERQQVQQVLVRIAQPFMKGARYYLERRNPDLIRGRLGNNHVTRSHGMFGLVPLALLYEVPEAAKWLDIEIQLHRDRLYPSAWAPDGEHLDSWDHFAASFGDPMPFAVALKQMGGVDFFNNPNLKNRFRGISRFYCYGLELSRVSSNWAYSWFALASQLRDPLAQWLATQYNNLKAVDDVFSYIFYDPTVPVEPPSESGSIYWPYSGMVKMCTDWNSQGILIPFRCGPQIGKDFGDQNGFRLRAGSEWLLPRLVGARRTSDQPFVFAYDLIRWFQGSAGQNVILTEPDKIGDFASYQKTKQLDLTGGIQISMFLPIPKGYEDGHYKQWLSGRDIPKTGELRVVHFDEALDYVCGEAHRAYVAFSPTLWVRHILFVKGGQTGLPPYILICDEIEADDQPRTFAWQLHSTLPLSVKGLDAGFLGKQADLDIYRLAPLDSKLFEKETPAVRDKERTSFVQWRTPTPQKRCVWLTALFPKPKGTPNTPSPSFRVVESVGGWAVEVSSKNATDIALFRSEHAQLVKAGAVSTPGTAALLRQRAKQPTTQFILGSLAETK
jgi:hypothetical protein